LDSFDIRHIGHNFAAWCYGFLNALREIKQE